MEELFYFYCFQLFPGPSPGRRPSTRASSLLSPRVDAICRARAPDAGASREEEGEEEEEEEKLAHSMAAAATMVNSLRAENL